MSGILGVWNMDGGPLARGVWAPMADQLVHLGPDGRAELTCDSAVFCFHRMNLTPESVKEIQPCKTETGLVALWDGRLDDREELLALLSGRAPIDAQSPDVALILAAYQVFGEEFTTRLRGDFALAIFDPLRRHVTLARDAMGARPLYYARVGPTIAFASEIKALLAHPAIETGVDEKSLAELIFGNWDHRDETNTLFSGIQRVPPATQVTFALDATRHFRFFDFDVHRELHLRDEQEYQAAYQEGFFRAVGRRLRSAYPTGTLVSGGLDSSSICCTAHALRQRRSGCPAILPLSLVADQTAPGGKDSSEWEFQQAVEEKIGERILQIPMRSFAAGDEFSAKVWHAEGPWLVENAYAELYRQAQGRGARVVLSGLFGDNLLMAPHFLLDLFLRGNWTRAWQSYQGMLAGPWYYFTDDDQNSAYLRRYLLREVKSFLVPEALRPSYRRWRYQRVVATGVGQYYAARLVAYGERVDPQSHVPCPPGRAHAKAIYIGARSKLLSFRVEQDAKAAAMFGVQLSYPFRDRDLIQLVMSMPGESVYPQGESRGIHRAAMQDILPEKVRHRRSKADFTQFARIGLLEDVATLPSPARGGSAARKMGWLAPEPGFSQAYSQLVGSLRGGVDLTKEVNDLLMNLLNLEAFATVFARK